jgi:hypothetical protein
MGPRIDANFLATGVLFYVVKLCLTALCSYYSPLEAFCQHTPRPQIDTEYMFRGIKAAYYEQQEEAHVLVICITRDEIVGGIDPTAQKPPCILSTVIYAKESLEV